MSGTTLFILIFGGMILTAAAITKILTNKIKQDCKNKLDDVQIGNLYVTDIHGHLDEYYENISNPFEKFKTYPELTVIVRDIKTNDNGQKWIAYQFVSSENETPVENTRLLSYAEVHKFLYNRVKVDKCY